MPFSSFIPHSKVKCGNVVKITSAICVWLGKTRRSQVNLVSLSWKNKIWLCCNTGVMAVVVLLRVPLES
jgi:hypothetical protein